MPQSLRELKVEEGKEKLMALEKEGIYVFHGSPVLLEELEPRQAHNFDKEKGEALKDGEPGVAATPFAEMAIFRAVIHNSIRINDHHWSRFGMGRGEDKDKISYGTTPEIFEKAKEAMGYVYVFRKQDFTKYKVFEWRSTKSVKPIRIFRVNFHDLPENIELEDFPEHK